MDDTIAKFIALIDGHGMFKGKDLTLNNILDSIRYNKEIYAFGYMECWLNNNGAWICHENNCRL